MHAPMQVSTILDLSQAVAEFVSANFPGQSAARLSIVLTSSQKILVPVVAPAPAPRPTKPEPVNLKDLQIDILDALAELPANKGISLDALTAKLDRNRSSVHRDGLKPLMRMGLVENDLAKGGYLITRAGLEFCE